MATVANSAIPVQYAINRAACLDDTEYHLRLALNQIRLAQAALHGSDHNQADILASRVRDAAEDLMDVLYQDNN